MCGICVLGRLYGESSVVDRLHFVGPALMIWLATVPWRRASTAYLWESVFAHSFPCVFSLLGVCLHTMDAFCQPVAVTMCVYICLWLGVCSPLRASGFFSLFLIMGKVYILILDYTRLTPRRFLCQMVSGCYMQVVCAKGLKVGKTNKTQHHFRLCTFDLILFS